MAKAEGDQLEQELHNWWDSLRTRGETETKPRQREHLAAEMAMGPEPKLSDAAMEQIKKDIAFHDGQQQTDKVQPIVETDTAQLYKTEWADWEFAKKQAAFYSEAEKGRQKLLDNAELKALLKSELLCEVRQWYSWRAGYLEHLIHFRYIDFGNKFILDPKALNEFERLVLDIMISSGATKPLSLWRRLNLELEEERVHDTENILIRWDPSFGLLTLRRLYWKPADRDEAPVSYSTFQRKIVPKLRIIKSTFTK